MSILKNGWIKDPDGNWNYYYNNTKVTNQFIEDGDKWYYLDENGIMLTGWIFVNNGWYYLHKSDDSKSNIATGAMVTGWFNDGNYWYFLENRSIGTLGLVKGKMVIGWLYYNDNWYYLSDGSDGTPKGSMYHDRTVEINGKNYTFNSDGSMKPSQYVTIEQLQKLSWIYPENSIDDLNSCLEKFNITTTERIRHFISQCAHESGVGYYMVEEGTGKGYEGRSDLGNTEVGDGPKFKGAGFIQITGRSNYQSLANYLGDQNVMQGCQYVAANYPWTSAGYWWNENQMNELIDNGASCTQVSAKVNCGNANANPSKINGLSERQRYYKLCCDIFN